MRSSWGSWSRFKGSLKNIDRIYSILKQEVGAKET